MKPPGGLLATASHAVLFPKAIDFSRRSRGVFCLAFRLKPPRRRQFRLSLSCSSESSDAKTASYQYYSRPGAEVLDSQPEKESFNFELRIPLIPSGMISGPKLSLGNQAFVLLTFIACTSSIAFTSLVAAAVPTLFAMRKAAISLSELADTAREELPSTMAAIRLSGMEISDLTLELNDLSQEIADGVNKSAQAVQAAEAGIRQIGSLAHHKTMSMIQERASLPIISLQPMVAGAAKKTSHAVGQATKNLWNIISRGERDSEVGDGNYMDRIEN